MIKYTLKCPLDHRFESWFKSNIAYGKLQAAGLVGCPVCGAKDVVKALMSPRVSPRTAATIAGPAGPLPDQGPDQGPDQNQDKGAEMHALTTPASPAEAAIAELKSKIQKHSEYVGSDFAAEARAIHDGDAPERSIYGEADAGEAKKLLEDGVPVAPLPFMSSRKTN